MGKDKKQARLSIRRRIRNKIRGNSERPRVAVFRSLKNIYVQAIDDLEGKTIVAASSQDSEVGVKSGGSVESAKKVGELFAKRLQDKGIKQITYDRGGFVYHGRVKAVAEAMRKAGLEF